MSESEERNYLEVLGEKLSLALGQAVWSFTRIEWLFYDYMSRLSRDDLDQLMVNQSFRSRTKIIRKLIDRSKADEETKTATKKLISEAESLSEKRNTFVHNPWQIWIDFDQKDFMTEIQRYANENEKVDLTELEKFKVDANALELKLKEALIGLTARC